MQVEDDQTKNWLKIVLKIFFDIGGLILFEEFLTRPEGILSTSFQWRFHGSWWICLNLFFILVSSIKNHFVTCHRFASRMFLTGDDLGIEFHKTFSVVKCRSGLSQKKIRWDSLMHSEKLMEFWAIWNYFRHLIFYYLHLLPSSLFILLPFV